MQFLLCLNLRFWYVMYFAYCFNTVVQNVSSASPQSQKEGTYKTKNFSNKLINKQQIYCHYHIYECLLGNYRSLLKITSGISLQLLLWGKVHFKCELDLEKAVMEQRTSQVIQFHFICLFLKQYLAVLRPLHYFHRCIGKNPTILKINLSPFLFYF